MPPSPHTPTTRLSGQINCAATAAGTPHPTPAATYLYTCLIYAVLTGRSPVGTPYTMDDMVPQEQARLIQKVAWDLYSERGDGL